MDFNLPHSTKVNRVIPKNAFYKRYNLNTKHKEAFTHNIERIKILHTISPHTIQVPATLKIEEIQIFQIELKQKIFPKEILQIIDKSIPYPILFYITYQDTDYCYAINLKTTQERDIYYSVWNQQMEFNFIGHNLEIIYENLVKKFIPLTQTKSNLQELVNTHKAKIKLEKEINKLKSQISKEVQLNRRIELNQQLRKLEKEYSGYL
jgi:hypothetical protein